MNKKYFVIIILSAALIISGIGSIVFFSTFNQFPAHPEERRTLTIGTLIYPSEKAWDLDPVNAGDSRARAVIDQVSEGLYKYDLYDPNLGIVPCLAADFGTWDSSKTQYTIPLRQNILFHDGTPFNAESVKWNFERINWFINGTGTLNTTIAPAHSLWKLFNGTSILNPTNPVTLNSEYNITINLSAPYAILESLLCHVSAFMLSLASTPKYDYIHPVYGKIVGTGPFVFDYYIERTKITFHRWENYWRVPAFFEDIIFYLFGDGTAIMNAMRKSSLDFIIGSVPWCISCRDIYEKYVDPQKTQGFSYYYLGMNNLKINKTWRQAISYAIDYTYITEELQDGTVYRANGPLAPNFPMCDKNIKAATWDLARARQILVDAGITNLTVNNDTTGPIADAWKASDFQSWNYSYNIGNDFREDLLIVLQHNLDLIGITVVDQGMTWDDFIYRAYGYMEPGGYDSLELYWIGFGSYVLSPYNMLAPLFSNQSVDNSVLYHNHTVEVWLEEALKEINTTKRAEIFSKILHQIVGEDMPHAFGYHPYSRFFHLKSIKGFQYNAIGHYHFYTTYQDSNS